MCGAERSKEQAAVWPPEPDPEEERERDCDGKKPEDAYLGEVARPPPCVEDQRRGRQLRREARHVRHHRTAEPLSERDVELAQEEPEQRRPGDRLGYERSEDDSIDLERADERDGDHEVQGEVGRRDVEDEAHAPERDAHGRPDDVKDHEGQVGEEDSTRGRRLRELLPEPGPDQGLGQDQPCDRDRQRGRDRVGAAAEVHVFEDLLARSDEGGGRGERGGGDRLEHERRGVQLVRDLVEGDGGWPERDSDDQLVHLPVEGAHEPQREELASE